MKDILVGKMQGWRARGKTRTPVMKNIPDLCKKSISLKSDMVHASEDRDRRRSIVGRAAWSLFNKRFEPLSNKNDV